MFGEFNEVVGFFFCVAYPVEAQGVGEGLLFPSGKLRGAEPVLHECEGSFFERGNATYAVIEKSWEELIGDSVDTIGGCGFLSHVVTDWGQSVDCGLTR